MTAAFRGPDFLTAVLPESPSHLAVALYAGKRADPATRIASLHGSAGAGAAAGGLRREVTTSIGGRSWLLELRALPGFTRTQGVPARVGIQAGGLALSVLLAALLGDPGRIEQVLANLVGNAVKFSRPEGTITVSVRPAASTVSITVADTGIGIAPDELPHVFERFFRSASSIKMAVPGTGLGLPIARAIALASGGALTVRSRPGAGTAFTPTLPLAAPPPTPRRFPTRWPRCPPVPDAPSAGAPTAARRPDQLYALPAGGSLTNGCAGAHRPRFSRTAFG